MPISLRFRILPFAFLAAAFFAPLASSTAAGETRPAKPNIVFILCDDLGYGDLGVFFQNKGAGDRKPRVTMAGTPRLDSIAKAGVQLRGHYTGAPVCAPARASLLLGVHQGHANVRDNQFDKALEDNHTLASVLKQVGYHTGCIGKWGLQGGKSMPAHPLNRGFDEYFGYISHGAGHQHYPKEDGKKLYDGRDEVSEKYDLCYTTDLFTARAKKFIVDQHSERPDQPFFLYLAFDTPHAKTQLPSCAYPEGTGVKGGLQWLGTPGEMINTAHGKPDSWFHPDHAEATWRDPAKGGKTRPWPDTAKRYATMVRRIDDCVFDLAATLRDLGIDRNTLVVFSSDNGISKESYRKGKDENGYSRNLDPGFFRGYGPFDGIKRDCLEGGVRVGALAWWPGKIPAGRVVERASQFHDWMPTFCELAGVPAPARGDGVSIMPDLTGAGDRPDSTVYVEYSVNGNTPALPDFLASRRNAKRRQMQMVRSGDLVGVRYNIRDHDNDFEIYDVVKDPAQRKNLAPRMADLQQRMKDRVLQIHRPNESAPRPYMDHLPVPAASPPSGLAPGLALRVIPHAVPWPVAAAAAENVTPTVVPAPQAAEPPVATAHGLVFSGWLKVPEDGVRTISLPAATKAVLKLHDATVLDTDRGAESGTIRLSAGLHPIFLSVSMAEGSPAPVLTWSQNGGETSPIPAELFGHRPE
ncbi:MAG: sulfatase-like hydrolase/transferase [Akkermansiaceae bacterium]|nr:sulfatase-like hydrolase/transferase [Akkermansiaceae bacterium]